jgi:hypothetical protein
MTNRIRWATKEQVGAAASSLARETWLTSWELIRITIPVAIATKILEELGFITIFSTILEPVMSLIGLPGALGLVWGTTMLTNMYAGITVFAALAPGLALTASQVTVLCSAILIAHSLPIELSVSKRAGAGILPIALLRVGGAVVYGYFLDRFCRALAIWQEPAIQLFKATVKDTGLWQWATDQLQNLAMIVGIIFCIVLGMRVLRRLGALGLLEKILAPILPWVGMGPGGAPITVVGMIMGIGYGGALIIRETSTGKLSREEVFNAMAFMGLCHGLVEDTLLMAAIGGKFGGILWGRIVFSLVVSYILVKVMRFLVTRRIRSPKVRDASGK